MKFAHMADLHLGGWRDPELGKINLQVFEKALDICVKEKVDFILVSGDFFDTSMPPFDILDLVSHKLNELKKAGISIYTISGSHDYSPSGKTILKVLENAELITNVAKGEEMEGKLKLKFTIDKKTGAKITGIFGRKGALEEEYFKQLDRSIEAESGYKIFLFHSGIEEYRPDYMKDVPAMPLSLLPKGFDYYAGGHIHHRSEHKYDRGDLIFPGALFPCNFQELERFGSGGFYIVEGKPRFVDLKENDVVVIKVDADKKSAKSVEAELEEKIGSLNAEDFILLIKLSGVLEEGRPIDINFRRLTEEAYEKGACVVRRNTNALSSKEYEEIKVSVDTVENLEKRLIKEHVKDAKLVEAMIKAFDTEKAEGETVAAYEDRINSDGYELVSKSRDLNKSSD